MVLKQSKMLHWHVRERWLTYYATNCHWTRLGLCVCEIKRDRHNERKKETEKQLWQFNACHWLFAQIIHASAKARWRQRIRDKVSVWVWVRVSPTHSSSSSSSSSCVIEKVACGGWSQISEICLWRWLSMSAIGEPQRMSLRSHGPIKG